MADPNLKTPSNVPGIYYVDDTCIDCDMCRAHAPRIFHRNDDTGFTFVARQPTTAEDRVLAEEALAECPADCIGSDGVLTTV
jgi:ferredoxin